MANEISDNASVDDAACIKANDNTSTRDSKKSLFEKNTRDVTENVARMGRLYFNSEISGDVQNPTIIIIDGKNDQLNSATANYLHGLKFSELQGVTVSFDLDADDADWSLWTDDILGRAKVAFETGPRGTFVDEIITIVKHHYMMLVRNG